MKKTFFAFVLAMSCLLGISVSSKTHSLSGETVTVTTLNLSNQAQAYCNESWLLPDGKCTGQFGDPTSRCLQPLDPKQSNCER